ncbi:MAG: glucose-1-phosphate adenylyltransferase [Candidatus Omnitrophica bacterium CG1_02_44_16]|nr:MAG: glucose-1-phosphate adenylyltransferase [Candidatus Omnitrophica bacterium CG1_02_44_16]PIY83165.1 MAG: glucose-1-phosphate adenylyltransferase [Candidatus Omnitrophica bacterium CG_4_10_14_0_8_um_filter_44_12]PIZ84027.1 MAG: glucose-1-phosphate adenylyltransferase [Candidatus Omnitrophica bacterium CG_4_10_14_0_2_um_filter_44_9]
MGQKVVTFILAGGKGERLHPLTKDRAKPAVPFGGIYRIIDITLSNCVNSGLRKIHTLIQYKSISLQRHIRLGWNLFNSELGEYIDVIPAQQRVGSNWYQGTADAIFQNIYTIEQEKPDEVLILAGDHIYKMNYYAMIDFHRQNNADMTVAVVELEKDLSKGLGVIQTDGTKKVLGFQEKPAEPKTIPDKLDMIYGSMGIYLFNRAALEEELIEDSGKNTSHDFGKDIIPQMLKKKKRVFAYNFKDENKKEALYWRDIGTLDAYYNANMDLVQVTPVFNLYDKDWPIRTYQDQFPPAKTVFAGDENPERIGLVLDSLICGGCIVSGGRIQRSILSPNVRVNSFTEIYDSLLMEGVQVGRHAKIRKAIIDKDINIPPGTVIGYNIKDDKKRFTISENGVVVVAKGTEIK